MAGVWKRDGTIAVTKGSKKVVGTGTTFADPKNAAAKGHLLVMVTGTAVDLYEVDYSESNSVFYLVEAYRGDTGTGKAYAIDTSRTDSIPEFARRLNATLGAYQQQGDAFQALLTSDAATIEVTAPDGTKHTMIPWKRVTSEGEGQAGRAKVEADKAAASAALAGSIVEASALPLPDVWAPLSDSLRLITGYGREVKVGDDVIARMLTFSRSTTKTYTNRDGSVATAEVNKPAFEKEGPLLEGASTNLITTSTSFKNASAGVSYEVANNPSFPHPLTRVIKPSGYGDVWTHNAELIAGTVYTASIYIDESALNSPAVVYYGTNSIAVNLVRSGVVVGGLERRTATFTCQVSGAHQIRVGLYTAAFDFVAGCPQIEPLPFASSYIPTNGAAVTRTADILTLQNPLNIPINAGDVTIALEVKRNPLSLSSLYPRVIHIGGLTWIVGDNYRFAMRGGTAEQGQLLKQATGSVETIVYRISGNKVTLYCSGQLATLSRVGVITVNNMVTNIGSDHMGLQNLFGHVRNLRVWRRALTDEQMKAIA